MPYKELSDLPKSVQEHLPKHARWIGDCAIHSQFTGRFYLFLQTTGAKIANAFAPHQPPTQP